jgi:type VI secretion system secreted protein Hcp
VKIFLNIPEIPGEATATGYAGQIECQSVTYELKSPRDPATGAATGKRRYTPLRIVKPWDKSSPALGQALINRTPFPKATFTFVQESPSFGAKHLVIELSGARVIGVEQEGVQGGAAVPADEISFIFNAIDITYSPPGTSARKISDSLAAP